MDKHETTKSMHALLDPRLIRFIEALACADAQRDHRLALAEGGERKERKFNAKSSDLRQVLI